MGGIQKQAADSGQPKASSAGLAPRAASAAAGTPPTVNTGGQKNPVVVLDGRELKIVTVRSPVDGHFSHIDSLRFTTKELAFDPYRQCITEHDFMDSMRHFLNSVFGFTTFEAQDKGRDFYLWTFLICRRRLFRLLWCLRLRPGRGCLRCRWLLRPLR